MAKLLFALVLYVLSLRTYAWSIFSWDEIVLAGAKTSANVLLRNCVKPPILNEEQLAACTTTYLEYKSELELLIKPASLEHTQEVDPYPWSTFSPCSYEISFLIVPKICVLR